jgi:phosphoglycerate dehydrogenase-like enzyme
VESLNVLVITPAFDKSTPVAYEEILRQIARVSPVINVRDASVLAHAEFHGDKAAKEQIDVLLAEAEVIYGLILPHDIVVRAPKMKWFQTMSAGVDSFARTDIWHSSVKITGVSGIHAIPIGEFVLEFMLMFAKQAPLCFQMKQKREWKRFMPSVLHSKTVGIVGLGNIGREVARLSKAFGMRVIATRRSVKQGTRARHVDRLFPPEELKQLIAASDYVVVSTPLTPETRGLIGEEELKAMKPTAHIINISRGGTIDEKALIRALEENRIAGAGLDVFATEPLPADSRLWELDNVIFSPHVAGGMEDYMVRATEIFCENLRRYLKGQKLINLIDKRKGY